MEARSHLHGLDLARRGMEHLAALHQLSETVRSSTPSCRISLIDSTRRLEQRQIVRLLLTPAVFALGSFLSYLYFRHQEYFQLIRDAYEGLAIAAFLVL